MKLGYAQELGWRRYKKYNVLLPQSHRWDLHDGVRNGRGLTPPVIRGLLAEFDDRLVADPMFDGGFAMYHLGPGHYWHMTRFGDLRPFSIDRYGSVWGPAHRKVGRTAIHWLCERYADYRFAENAARTLNEIWRLRDEKVQRKTVG